MENEKDENGHEELFVEGLRSVTEVDQVFMEIGVCLLFCNSTFVPFTTTVQAMWVSWFFYRYFFLSFMWFRGLFMAHMYFICTFLFFSSICSLVDLQTVIIRCKCFWYSDLSLRSRADIVSFVPQFLALQKRPCYFELHHLNFLYIAVSGFYLLLRSS